MQLVRRTVGRRTTLNFVEKSLGYNVNPTSGASSIQTYDIVMVDKLLLHCAARSSKVVGSGNRVLEILRDQSTNGVARWFCLGKDEVSISRPSQAVTKKPVRRDALNSEFSCRWKADSRGGQHPFGVHWRGSVSSLHTEVKGDKPRDEKSEDVTTVRRINSAVKEKASSKTRRQSVRSEVSKPIPRESTADLKFPSVRDEDQKCLPMSRRGLEFTAHKEGDQELATVEEEYGSAELHHEETQKRSFLKRGDLQQLLPSESTYDVQKLGGKEADEVRRRASAQAMALLRAALDEADEDDGKVEEEFQRSLRVGIVGAPNAGKSLLTNQLVGARVSAVSRKTNTTHREHLGVFTKGDTQLLYYDTPGLHLDIEGSPLRVDAQHRVRNAWEIVDFCEALVVLVDAERQIRRPDKRVQRLVEKLGTEQMVSQKRVLCLNKVDLIEQKKLLLPLAKQFEDLLGYDRIFMISGLTGSGVKDVKDYLLDQAVLRPWDEDPELTNHRDIALEIVREQVFEHLHEELPHTTKQKLVSWKVLKDGSVRIQQLLLVAKKEHQKILVGKNGAVIGDIGIKARKELQQILGVTVHLVLDVKLMTSMMTGDE